MKELFSFVLAAYFALVLQALAQTPKSPLTLKPPTPAAGDGFGTAVVAFGNNILVGAPGDDSLATDAGAVYLYEGGTGRLLRAFLNPTPAAGDSFGAAIAVAGGIVVIGAPGEDTGARNAGAAYLFDGNTGARLATLSNPNAGANDGLGSSVAATSNLVIVGAPFADAQASDVGAVDLFDLANGQFLTRIVNSDNVDVFAHFGIAVAAVGNNFAVGTPSDGDETITSFGSISLFNGANRQLIRNIPNPLRAGANPTPASDNGFGQSIAVLDNRLLVGAPFNPNFAAAYFVDGATGNLIQRFPSPAPGRDNWFGFSLAIAGNNVIVGAPSNDPNANGAVYVFDGGSGARLRTFSDQTSNPADRYGFAVAVAGNDTLIGAPSASSGVGVVYAFGPAVACQLTFFSPLRGSRTCEDSIQIKALVKISGGVRPFNRIGNVNGTTANFAGDTLFASIPLALGANAVIVNCTVTDSVGAQTVCSDTTSITRFAKLHNIVINEILYDPNYDDLGTERIELKNMGDDTTKLDGFALWIRHEDLDTYWLFPDGFSLMPGGLLTVHWLKDGIADRGNVFTGEPTDENSDAPPDDFWGNNSSDANEMVLGGAGNDVPFTLALFQQIRREATAEFHEACRMIDFAQIGNSFPEIDSLAAQAGLWNMGEFLNFIPAGHSYEFDTTASPPILTAPGAFTDQASPSIGFKNVLAPPPSQHLLISEICARPAFGEFVEIHNPTAASVNLSNYYLTDNVKLRDNAYTLLVKGASSLNLQAGEFLVKFPDGAQIGPGGYQTVAFQATDFKKRYGQNVNPTYEINNTDLKVPDMIVLGRGTALVGLTDDQEAIILLRWNGASDLIEDVDYVAWGAPFVNKTGLGLDGVDSSLVRSYYDNEKPDSQQQPVASQVHALLKSWQRRTTPRELGELRAGGNGISGHDETSENLALAFKEAKTTPNQRSKSLDLVFSGALIFDSLGTASHDGILDRGEFVKLRIELQNRSIDSTGTLFSFLRTSSPFITLGPDTTSTFANMNLGDSLLSTDTYEFSVADRPLPPQIDFVLFVVDKLAGSVETVSIPFSLLTSLKLNTAFFSVSGTDLVSFVSLKNTATESSPSGLTAQIIFDGLGGANTKTIAPIDPAAIVPPEEKLQLQLAPAMTLPGGLLDTDTLRGCLKINSNLQNAKLVVKYAVPLISVTVEYYKSRILVPDVDVIVKDMSTAIPTVIATKKTNLQGRAEFTLADFNNVPLNPAKTYQVEATRMENILSNCASYFQGINCTDLTLCFIARAKPLTGPTGQTMDEKMLGDVGDPPNGIVDLDDCNAINAFARPCGALCFTTPCPVDGSLPCTPSGILKTGEWRFLAPVPAPVASPIGTISFSGTATKQFIAFKAFRLGDLNTSWTPPPPPGSATAPTALRIDPGAITITTAICTP